MIILKKTITLATNKTIITDKTLSCWRRKRKKKEKEKTKKQKNKNKRKKTKTKNNDNTYSLHPNYEKITLFNMQRKHHVH